MWPGEIYMADFGAAGPHPVIVVSREELNRGRYALVVVCTLSRFSVRSKLPNGVPFHAGDFRFISDCVAQCENMLSIDKVQLDIAAGPLGKLDDMSLRDVIKAIGYVIESDCEPIGTPLPGWNFKEEATHAALLLQSERDLLNSRDTFSICRESQTRVGSDGPGPLCRRGHHRGQRLRRRRNDPTRAFALSGANI